MATTPNLFTSLAAEMIGEAPPPSADTTPSTPPTSAPTPTESSPSSTEEVTVTPPAAPPVVEGTPSSDGDDVDDLEINFDDPVVGEKKDEGAKPTVDPKAVEAKTEQEEVDDLHKQIKAGVYKTPEEIENAFLRTSRGRQQLADFKLMRELAAPPTAEGGGIGFRPSIDQVKGFYNKSVELESLDDQFYSGDPAQQTQFWSAWFSKTPDGKPHPTGISAASTIAEGLFRADPAYYRAMADPVLKDASDHFLEMAKAASEPRERAGYLDAARVLAHFINPDSPLPELPKEFIKTGVMPPPQKPSPEAEELARLKAQQSERESNERKVQEDHRKSAISTARTSLVQSDIEKAMKFLDPVSKSKPLMVQQAKSGLMKDVMDAVGANKAGRLEYNRLYQKAMSTGQQSDIDAAANKFREIARPVIKHFAIKYYKEYGSTLVKESSDRHQRATEASQKVGTTATGQPAAQPAGAIIKPQAGESQEQTLKRTFAGILSSVG